MQGIDGMLFQQVPERRPAFARPLGRAGHVAQALFHEVAQVLDFKMIDHFFFRCFESRDLFFGRMGMQIAAFQHFPGDQGLISDHDQLLDDVFQFADIARPVVVVQGCHRLLGEADSGLAVFAAIFFYEMVGKHGDIFAAFPERRDLEFDDVEPVIEIFPEVFTADQFFQVFVGGGDDLDVGMIRLCVAQRLEFLFLDQAQQLDLDEGGDGADLVEEQGAVFGFTDQPFLGIPGVGKGAADMAEQLIFEKVFRDSAAVDRDERLPAAPA